MRGSTGRTSRAAGLLALAALALMAPANAGAAVGQEAARDAREARERVIEELRAVAEARHAVDAARTERVREEMMAMVEARHALAEVRAERVREALHRDVDMTRERIERMHEELAARGWAHGARSGRDARDAWSAPAVPEAWLAQDPADSLYRAARDELNRGRYDRAAGLFAQIRSRFPRSGYVGDSYYFQALALQRAGGSRSLRQALELLGEQDRTHRNASTIEDARALRVRIEGALARTGDADAAARIQERASAGCESEEQELRSAALGALLQMDAERAVPILREVLRSRDVCSAELRKHAVFLVSQKMTPETVDILLDLAHRNPDPDAEVREAAVFWLSQVRSEEAVAALESILRDADDPALQEKAIFAISQHPSERAGEIMHSYAVRADAPRNLREQAIFWIGQRRGAENKEFLRDLYGRLSDAELKEKVIFGVAQSPSDQDRAWLIALAKNGSEPIELRKNALFWAGQSGRIPAADFQELYRTMPDPEMKEQVIFALSQSRGAESVTALMDIAENEQDNKLRQRAVFWLGQSKDPRVPEFLLRLIKGGG